MTEQTDSPEAIFARYADGPSLLGSAIDGLSETDMDLSLNPDEFTIRQYFHHVVDSDYGWTIGIRAALGNSDGLFSNQWYFDKPQTLWAERWHYSDRVLEPALDLLRANRRYMVHLLEQIPDAWERSIRIQWPDHVADEYQRNLPIGQEGRITVGRMIRIQANHVVHHADDIGAIRRFHAL